jgi:3D (Asp-Asp-Asp) domain-containing protein
MRLKPYLHKLRIGRIAGAVCALMMIGGSLIMDPLTTHSRVPDTKPPSHRPSYKNAPDSGLPIAKFPAVEVIATAYHAGKECTGKVPGQKEYGITYSGIQVKRDEFSFSTIAADPKVLPIGTVLYIPGYGYGIVADTGSAIKGKKIDLYYEKRSEVFGEWGKRKVKVYVVKKGNGKLNGAIWRQLQNELLPTKVFAQ